MLIERIKYSYNDRILNAMDQLLSKSEFNFECLDHVNSETQIEILNHAREIYHQKDSVRICSICHRTELIKDEWMSNSLCLDCGRIRNNKGKVSELLNSLKGQ
ncbi:MAG: hypothetical protein N2484_15920 [Clostridia bacterium]|nr:hypothetical protein [Clostridia bacterium]